MMSKEAAKKLFQTISLRLNIKTNYISVEKGGVNATLIKYQTRNKHFYVKIPQNGLVKPEVFFLNKLRKHNIPAPKIIYHDTSLGIIPYPFLILERIEGGQSFEKHIKDKIAIEGGYVYGQWLYKIHKIRVNGFGLPIDTQGKAWTNRTWVAALRNFLVKNIKPSTPEKIFTETELKKIYNLTINNSRLNIKKPVLLHGDIPNGIMRLQPKIELLAFIDPGEIIGGDFIFDISSIYCLNEKGEFGSGFMKGLLLGYTKLHKFTYEEKYRFRCLRLFHLFWKTCFFYDHEWQTDNLYNKTAKLLRQFEL